jgi:hypothetical protein
MFGALEEAVERLRSVVAELDPDRLRGEDALALLARFAEAERLCAGGRTLLAARVERSRVWRVGGHQSAAHFLAERTGTSVGEAVGTLETARRLPALSATERALRSGELSATQAREVTAAAGAAPEAEGELLATAGSRSVTALRQRCRTVLAAARDDAGAEERLSERRSLRHWSEPDGTLRLDARLCPDDGARVLAALRPRAQRLAAEARRRGRSERDDAVAADALVEAVLEGSAGAPSVVHVRVDWEALQRGSVRGEEVCEVPGVGPLPVSAARRLAEDAVVKVLLTDAVDVRAVASAGRTIPAALRTALEDRGRVCAHPGCDTTRRLEIDHVVALTDGGTTTLDNLQWLCGWHHRRKHHGAMERAGPAATGA